MWMQVQMASWQLESINYCLVFAIHFFCIIVLLTSYMIVCPHINGNDTADFSNPSYLSKHFSGQLPKGEHFGQLVWESVRITEDPLYKDILEWKHTSCFAQRNVWNGPIVLNCSYPYTCLEGKLNLHNVLLLWANHALSCECICNSVSVPATLEKCL